MDGPWNFKTKRLGSRRNGGEQTVLRFGGDDMFVSRWYPPWQNDLMRANAKCIVDDLNAAFAARKFAAGEQCEHGIVDGNWCHACNARIQGSTEGI